jgi:tetratricopeptide (TPR) repeat protein
MSAQQGFLQEREGDLKGRRQRGALSEIDSNFDNIRAAWRQAVKRRNYTAVDAMIDGLYWFCWMQGRFHDGAEMFHFAQEQLAPLPGEAPHPVWYRVRARWPQGNASTTLKQSLEFAREHNNAPEIAFCLSSLGDHATWDGDLVGSIAFYEESLAYYRDIGEPFHLAYVLRNRAGTSGNMGDVETFFRLTEESLKLQREIGDRIGEALTLGNLGFGSLAVARYEQAEHYGEQALAIYQELGNRLVGAQGFIILAIAIPGMLKSQLDLERFKTLAQQALALASDYQDVGNIGRALLTLGFVDAIEEKYAGARQLAEEGQNKTPNDPVQLTLGNYLLAYIACGQEDYLAAREYLNMCLRVLIMIGLREPIKRMIPPAAAILRHAGRPERAVEILGLSFSDFASATEGQRQLPVYARLQEALKVELGETAYQAAWEKGTTLDALTVAQEVLAENE